MIHNTCLKVAAIVCVCIISGCLHSRSVSLSHSDSSAAARMVSISDTSSIDSADIKNGVDFSTAFDSADVSKVNQRAIAGSMYDSAVSGSVLLRYPPYHVDCSQVRIALRQKLTQASFFSVGNVELHSSKGRPMVFRGRLNTVVQEKGKLTMDAAWGKINVQLPCTLVSHNEYNLIDLEQDSYRGKMILYSDSKTSFSVVNALDVEEYLRGVVPLEIGKLDTNGSEALKAQAVAARTYTYKRIHERQNAPFDMLSTTADQVYGGFKPEYREADLAIRLTKNLILMFNDSIIHAYYHSTCGGTTANIEDIWKNKPACEYLRSENDKDPSGRPYCSDSKSFTWEETWKKEEFNKIVTAALRGFDNKQSFKPPVTDISISSLYSCGRIQQCIISGNRWKYESGGDQIRFILKRASPGNPILKSSNFSVTRNTSKGVTVKGIGYGHGIGMCQTGAIGRARSGQTFEQILRAYYRGVVICTASYTK